MSTTLAERRRVYPDIDQLLLRAMVVLGGATMLVAAQLAGARPAQWQQAVLIGFAVLTALRPESVTGLALLAGGAYLWALTPESLSPLVLLVAVGMVLAHVSALVAAQGPARMRVDGVQVRRWAGRALVLWLAAVIVWGLSVLLADLPERRLAYALGLTVLGVIAVVTTWLISPRPDRERLAALDGRASIRTEGPSDGPPQPLKKEGHSWSSSERQVALSTSQRPACRTRPHTRSRSGP